MDILDSLADRWSSRSPIPVAKTVQRRDCWVSLPVHLAGPLFQKHTPLPAVIKIHNLEEPGSDGQYACWGGGSCGNDHVEIPYDLSRLLGIRGGSRVRVEVCHSIPEASQAQITLPSGMDLEVLTMEKGTMEETILNQVGAVFSGQAFPLYLRNQAPFVLKTVGVSPGPIARLGRSTELEVFSDTELKHMSSHNPPETQVSSKTPAMDGSVAERVERDWEWLRLLDGDSELFSTGQFVGTLKLPDLTAPCDQPATDGEEWEEGGGKRVEVQSLLTTACLMCDRTAEALGIREGDVACITSGKQAGNGVSDKVEKLMLAVLVSSVVPLGHVLVTSPVRKSLEVDVFDYVRVKAFAVAAREQLGKNIGLHPVSFHEKSANSDQSGGKKGGKEILDSDGGDAPLESINGSLGISQINALRPVLDSIFVAWVSCQLEIAGKLSSGANWDQFALQTGSVVHMAVKSPATESWGSPRELTYLMETNKGAHSLECHPEGVFFMQGPDLSEAVKAGTSSVTIEQVYSIEDSGMVPFPTELACLSPPPWLSDELREACAHIRPSLTPDPMPGKKDATRVDVWPTGVLVTGAKGSGRTSFVSGIARAMYLGACVSVEYIPFSDLPVDQPASGNGTSMRNFVSEAIMRCLDRAPGLVILDDLDVVCPASDAQEDPASNPESSSMAVWLVDAIHYASNGQPIVFIATCESLDALSEELRSSGLLGYHVTLPAHNSVSRSDIFTRAIQGRGGKLSGAPLKDISVWGTGYEARDLVTLADRTIRQHVVEKMGNPRSTELSKEGGAWAVREGDIEKARDGFKPAAFWHAYDDHGHSDVNGWEDIGGLHAVKAVLREAVQLPIQFSTLMALCPLRLRTGVLLFGPPGCGKTYVVVAAVKAMNVRLISVKGPELFNKYIGASEAAVRGVFERAASCAPCVLFFDEFEALAPARGHDSTGVSDRVVNQLLTELDGVEGLRGVCVIAASSRPDLIDPALLRPGRLDKWVHCPLPTQTDRAEILQALSRKLLISAQVSLWDVAGATNGFTGADLSAVLSEAHLHAVNTFLEQQDDDDKEEEEANRPVIQIMNVDFEVALTRVKPSVSCDEIDRLEGLYAGFRQDVGDANKAALMGNVGKRATLA